MSEHGLGKNGEETPRKFKNEWSTWQVMLPVFWDCCGFVYTEFGPAAHKK